MRASGTPVRHQARQAEHPKVLRNRRSADRQLAGERHHGARAASELAEDLDAARVTERCEDGTLVG